MTDIVERLRSTSEPLMINHWGRTALEGEAAAEIECLRGTLAEAQRDLKSECERRDEIIVCITKLWEDAKIALAEARGAMRPFKLQAEAYGDEPPDHTPLDCADYINVGDLRRAAQWLEKNP